MFLGFVMGDQMKQFDSMKIFHKFVAAAFLPAAVAVPFAAGFMILSQVTQVDCTRTVVAAGLGFCKDMGPIIHGVNTIWGLLMLLIGFFIIWMGFWAALSIDEIYVQATGAIKSFGEQAGKVAVKIPFSAPIIPTGKKGEKMSVLGIDDKMRQFSAGLSSGGSPGKIFGGSDDTSKKVVDTLNDPKSTFNTALANIGTAMNEGGKTVNRANLTAEIQAGLDSPTSALSEALNKAGIEPKNVSAATLVPQLKNSASSAVRKIFDDMEKNDAAGAAPPAAPAPPAP